MNNFKYDVMEVASEKEADNMLKKPSKGKFNWQGKWYFYRVKSKHLYEKPFNKEV